MKLYRVINQYQFKFNITEEDPFTSSEVIKEEKNYTILIQELKTRFKIFYLDNNFNEPILAGMCRKTKSPIKDKENLDLELELVENTLKMETLFKLCIE